MQSSNPLNSQRSGPRDGGSSYRTEQSNLNLKERTLQSQGLADIYIENMEDTKQQLEINVDLGLASNENNILSNTQTVE